MSAYGRCAQRMTKTPQSSKMQLFESGVIVCRKSTKMYTVLLVHVRQFKKQNCFCISIYKQL